MSAHTRTRWHVVVSWLEGYPKKVDIGERGTCWFATTTTKHDSYEDARNAADARAAAIAARHPQAAHITPTVTKVVLDQTETGQLRERYREDTELRKDRRA